MNPGGHLWEDARANPYGHLGDDRGEGFQQTDGIYELQETHLLSYFVKRPDAAPNSDSRPRGSNDRLGEQNLNKLTN